MGVKTFSNNTSPKYIFHRKAGRNIIERRPIFSPDGESVILIVEDIVRVYNIQTGDCVRALETESTINELVGIQFPEDEEYNLYGCSDDGCITTWTWESGAVLREINLKLPIGLKVLTFDMLDSTRCFITGCKVSHKDIFYATYCIKTGHVIIEFKPKIWFKNTGLVRVALGWCNGSRFAAIVNGTKYLTILNLDQPHVNMYLTNYNEFRILSVAAHHRESAIAIADTNGRVTVIKGYLFDHSQLSRELLHWHFLPAFAVSFSKQGSYLYSGGMEEVLIKWTVGHLSNKAGEKEFIPRLPGMIRYITVNNTHVAMTLANNSVVIASTQMRVVSTILECGGLSPAVRAVGTALAYHRPLGALLVAGRSGHLQLYSTVTDKVLFNVDITGFNHISPHRENLVPLETEVTCAVVSRYGNWLVTSEYRNDGFMYPEEKLKFWTLKVKNVSPFMLNTCVNLSHGGCKVVSLAIDYKGDYCVSGGADQKFRIWKRISNNTSEGNKVSWICTTACYYSSGISQFLSHDIFNQFKVTKRINSCTYLICHGYDQDDIIQKIFHSHKDNSLVDAVNLDPGMKKNSDYDMGGVAMSRDSSLIAAWFGCKLTLWDMHQSTLRTVLSHPALRPKGKEVEFGNFDAARYLVCTTDSCLAVWSLLSLTIKWLVQINPVSLASDPMSDKMAITTSNNDVFVFSPHSSTPILSRKSLLDPQTGVFKLCTFGVSNDNEIRLHIMRNNSEIYSLEPEKTEEGSLEVISRRSLPTSNFSALLAEQQLSDVRPAAPVGTDVEDVQSGKTSILQFLTASSHMVPPVSLMCTSFLQELSGQETWEETSEDKEESMEVDPDSSDDEDIKKTDSKQPPKVTQFWMPSYEDVKEKKLNKILKEPFLDLHTTAAIFGM